MPYNRALMKDESFNLAEYFLGEDRLPVIGDNHAIDLLKCAITYKKLRAEVDYWQKQILSEGVKAGDRVALLLYDSPEFIAVFLAAIGVGAIAVPINTFLPREDLEYILRDCEARLTFIEDELESRLRLKTGSDGLDRAMIIIERSSEGWKPRGDGSEPVDFAANTNASTPAFLLYTSGSTGVPKGVLHLHGAIPFTIESYSKNVLSLSAKDRTYSASRLFFAYGLGNSLSFPLAAGACVILDTERPNAARVAGILKDKRPNLFFGVPAIYNSLLEYREAGNEVDVSSLRLCVSAGEALPSRVLEDWQNVFNVTLLDGIGSTEMLHIFLSNREGDVKAGSSGKAVTGYEAKLVDDLWVDVACGEMGNLWVKGGSATKGYWGREDLTALIMKEGWVKTGDVYRQDTEGYFYHIGRSDDCFKVSGLWVSPIEVESVLLKNEHVSEAAVVAGVGEEGLATVKAYVVIRQDVDCNNLREALFNFLSEQLPRYKVPSSIEFLDSLPRTSTGKIQRFKLRSE